MGKHSFLKMRAPLTKPGRAFVAQRDNWSVTSNKPVVGQGSKQSRRLYTCKRR